MNNDKGDYRTTCLDNIDSWMHAGILARGTIVPLRGRLEVLFARDVGKRLCARKQIVSVFGDGRGNGFES
jgi:hypothetical protein